MSVLLLAHSVELAHHLLTISWAFLPSCSPFLLLIVFYVTGGKNLQLLRCDARCREPRSAHASLYTPLALGFGVTQQHDQSRSSQLVSLDFM
ncbi:uncharacterized [Tachysurus ichikawai]